MNVADVLSDIVVREFKMDSSVPLRGGWWAAVSSPTSLFRILSRTSRSHKSQGFPSEHGGACITAKTSAGPHFLQLAQSNAS